MRVTPHIHMLRAVRDSGRPDYVALSCEAIDNSFDASANKVEISLSEECLKFTDDGIGVTLDRIPMLFTFGGHAAMKTTGIGRYGYGITAQTLRFGDILSVRTRAEDGCWTSSANWRDMLVAADDRAWEIPDPVHKPHNIGDLTGTTVEVRQLRNGLPKFKDETVRNQIAMRFHPALVDGKTIVLNGTPVAPLPEPQMTDVIDCRLQLSEGRSADLRAGILRTTPSPLNQVHIGYRHRVIIPKSSLGCGNFGGISRLFARVQLHGHWNLGVYKDDLPDEGQRSELDIAVNARLLPLLEKCQEAGFDAKLDRIEASINSKLPEEMAARPRRSKQARSTDGEKFGRHGGKVAPDKTTDEEGPAKTRRSRPSPVLLITLEECAEQDGVGAADRTNPSQHRVRLARDNSTIKLILDSTDEKAAVQSLLTIALCIYRADRGSQAELPFEAFGQSVAKLLAIQDQEDIALKVTRRNG
jgi:hypothetical protein